MQFALFFNQPLDELERHEAPATAASSIAPWKAYMDEMAAARILRGGSRLAPPWTAKTVRSRNGTRHVQDGPFADTKELAAGFVIIDVPSLDDALYWAHRSPSTAIGSTEIRPIAVPSQ